MRSEIRSLTGLRGIAACWVMIGHYGLDRWSNYGLIRTFGSHSYIAVDLFMVLSGFVLAMTYEGRFVPLAWTREYGRFLQHRLTRIFPLYALTTAACLLFLWIDEGLNNCDHCALAVAANSLMVQGWWWPIDSFNGPAWSISVEWALNLLFPLFVLVLLRSPTRHAALAAGGAALCLTGLGLLQGQINHGQEMIGALNWYLPPNSLLRCAPEFMLGLYCWRLRAHAVWTQWLGRTPVLLAILGGILVITVVPSLDVVFVLLCCCLMLGFSYERSWVADWFGGPVLHWLGMISFSIYLWHITLLPIRALFIWLLTGSRVGGFSPVATATEAALCVTAALGVSAVSYYRFEKPTQRWLRQLFEPRRLGRV